MAGNIWNKYEDMKQKIIEQGKYVELIDDIIEELNKLEEQEEKEQKCEEEENDR